jgi:hypothetical protein
MSSLVKLLQTMSNFKYYVLPLDYYDDLNCKLIIVYELHQNSYLKVHNFCK